MAYENLPIVAYQVVGANLPPTKVAVPNNMASVSSGRFDTVANIRSNYMGGGYVAGCFHINHTIWANLPMNTERTLYELKNGNKIVIEKTVDNNHVYVRIKYPNNTYMMIYGSNNWPDYRYNMNIFILHDPAPNAPKPYPIFFYATKQNETDGFITPGSTYMTVSEWDTFINGAVVDTPDPYGTAEPIEEGEGGYGDFDYSSDDDTIPSLPNISVTAAGFVNLFKMTATEVANLANYLWSGLFDLSTYLKLFGDPMECILSLGIVPLNPAASTPLYIVVGNHATTIQAPRITDQFQELDCGSITVQGSKYSNSFLDYSPYTSAQLYLPYVGTVALDVDEIMDSTIHIVYHIDLLSGSCVAYVEVTKNYTYQGEAHEHKNVLYQYSGNVLTNVPITSQNFTQVLQAVIGAVAVGVSGGSAAGVAAGSGEAAGAMTADQAAAAVGATTQMKAPVSRSGNCSSACGLLGTQTPKLMLTLPKIAYAEDMNKERGYPTYMRKTISSMSGTGFTKVELAHLKSIPCTDSERDEIIKLLESGVEL